MRPWFLGGLALSASACTIVVPATVSDDACPPVDPSWQGFAFEEASWPQYIMSSVNDTSPNQYTINMMKAIVSRTGGHPIIRLGGTSAEYALFEPGQSYPALPVAEINNVQSINGTTIGPSFFALTRMLSLLNAEYIVQLPLATNNISEVIAWAGAALQEIGIGSIKSLEIGNEPNAFGLTKASSSKQSLTEPMFSAALSNQSYALRFDNYSVAISSALGLDASEGRIFQTLDAAAELNGHTQYDVATVFEAGVDREDNINAVAWHYYQTTGGNYSSLGPTLMNHSAIVERLNVFKPFISYLRDQHNESSTSLPFVVDEIGNSLDGHQDFSYQAVLGSALWQADWQLYALSIGVARSNWQQIMRAAYGMWLPRESGGLPAQTYANFYAMPFVGDFLGDTNGTTRVSVWDIDDQPVGSELVAYGAFVADQPARVAILNLQVWDLPGANTTVGHGGVDGNGQIVRPFLNVSLKGVRAEWIQVKYLDSPHGAHANASTITYGGSQWTAESCGREVLGVKNDTAWLAVVDGEVDVAVSASSAVLVDLLGGHGQ